MKTAKQVKTDTVKRKTANKPVVRIDKSLSERGASLKNRVQNVKKTVVSRFNNLKKELAKRQKKARKTTSTQRQLANAERKRGIIGIGLLFVVVSITYSTYMTNLFVDGSQMVLALAPQVIFASIVLLIAFYKIYK